MIEMAMQECVDTGRLESVSHTLIEGALVPGRISAHLPIHPTIPLHTKHGIRQCHRLVAFIFMRYMDTSDSIMLPPVGAET